ncbi:phenylacetaldoxime dehydratase family protein [Streptomyces sp. NPDC051987]|uniref:phenylacetaldoxime dehydratase family protein n=1 Tax=Streptomyces sp. NPDC051987 TaxID=3155808 RepID=UPI0034393575
MSWKENGYAIRSRPSGIIKAPPPEGGNYMAERSLESAIAPHLDGAAPESCCDNPSGRRPAFDSYTARLSPGVGRVVVAYLGVQGAPDQRDRAYGAVRDLAHSMAGPAGGATHHELVEYTDELGYVTVLTVGYWLDMTAFDAWFDSVGRAWNTTDSAGLGTFIEVVRPSVRRLETLYSSDRYLQGVGAAAETVSGPVLEHGYWGGMRDRIPDARDDRLVPQGHPGAEDLGGGRVRITPHQNACLIRSGQDFSRTTADERLFYLERVEPQLRRGMEFLRDDGLAVGCYTNRYVTVLDGSGSRTEKTFAVSWWRDLADLEGWARSHATHVKIFAAFNAHMLEFGQAAQLRLYHEVMVLPKGDQFFEYRNCHERTGMLRSRLAGGRA